MVVDGRVDFENEFVLTAALRVDHLEHAALPVVELECAVEARKRRETVVHLDELVFGFGFGFGFGFRVRIRVRVRVRLRIRLGVEWA